MFKDGSIQAVAEFAFSSFPSKFKPLSIEYALAVFCFFGIKV